MRLVQRTKQQMSGTAFAAVLLTSHSLTGLCLTLASCILALCA